MGSLTPRQRAHIVLAMHCLQHPTFAFDRLVSGRCGCLAKGLLLTDRADFHNGQDERIEVRFPVVDDLIPALNRLAEEWS